MKSQRFDLIVIGAGVTGVSTCLAAAKSGVKSILCLDQHGVANEASQSGDGMRLFRLSYFEHPAYVPLLRRAIEGWKSLGDDLYVPVGGFYAGLLDSDLVQGSLESANQHEIPHEIMPSAVAKKRFPTFDLPPEYFVFVEPEGGFVRAANGTRAIANAAEKLGVEIRVAEVLQVLPKGNRWAVEGDGFAYEADQVIVAAGSDTGSLVPAIRPHVTSHPHLVMWMEPHDLAWFDAPGFGIMDEEGSMLYGFPSIDEVPGVKIGGHHRFQADTLEAQESGLKDLAKRFLPSLKDFVLSRKSCAYDMSPDENFIFGSVEPGLSVACGFSGHGFKFGPVLGELAWQAANEGLPDELKFLSVDRLI